MYLFKYENYNVTIDPEALLIKAFRDIWQRDNSEDKSIASLELGYVYFMEDPRSDFTQFTDKETRSTAIIQQEGFPSEWSPDEKVLLAQEVYANLSQTTSSLALKDCQIAIEKIRAFLTNFDLNERDEKQKLVMPINQYTQSIKLLNQIAEEVYQTEKKIAKEIEEEGRLKGERMKTLLDDGISNLADLVKNKG